MTANKIVQYVIMRKDLLPNKKSKAFSTGAFIAQACHAAAAALHRFSSTDPTTRFLNDLENMTVCVLGVEDKIELESLAQTLANGEIPFHLWIEKPENIPTALATAPVEKQAVWELVGHLKLLR